MILSVPLLAIVLLAAIVLPPATSIKCYSNSACSNGQPVCEETCPASFHFCAAFYTATGNTLQSALFGCVDDSLGDNVPDHCAITNNNGSLRCFCGSDLCNNIGIPISIPTTPPTAITSPPKTSSILAGKPTGLDPDTLYCKYSLNGEVGYQVCEDAYDPEYSTSDPYHRGCYGAYQVQANGTLVATSQHCIHRFFGFCNFTQCHLSTQGDNTDLTATILFCCCNSSECNIDSPDFHPDRYIYPTKPPHSSVYPNCSFDYCTKNKNSLCLRTDSDGNCTNQLTSCSACYFASEERPLPEQCRCDRKRYRCAERSALRVTANVEMKLEKCLKKWGKCVKKSYNRLYGKTSRRLRKAAFFRCPACPCSG